jgi:preprotein translocase subunit SecB
MLYQFSVGMCVNCRVWIILSIWQDCKQSMSELFVVSIAVAGVSKIIGVAQNKRLQMLG